MPTACEPWPGKRKAMDEVEFVILVASKKLTPFARLFKLVPNTKILPSSLLQINLTWITACAFDLKLDVSSPLKRYVGGSEVPTKNGIAVGSQQVRHSTRMHF
jgi:hypothetical protein